MASFSSEEWRRVSPLVDELMELEPEQQLARLTRELSDEPDLRERVERLLHADRAAEGFLVNPSTGVVEQALSEFASDAAESVDPPAGGRVGAYRLLKEIGHGGMGSVYLAERDDAEFQHRVAIKFVRGGVAGREARRRFLRERQILADLEHRNIARLLDGGTTDDGVPYLVMEYVEGKPIDRYCDDLALDVRERLGLFEEVCEAVQYAHGHLVVHRDLKPGNILVTSTGRVKLLDFGVAKLLDPDRTEDAGPETRTGMRLLTPEFASPEQLAGRTVTVAADVYSLGVLLYLLLSGRLPYPAEDRSRVELARRITDEPPDKPSVALTHEQPERVAQRRASTVSGLKRRLRGDIDNIALKALRPEPERRYPSVSALLEDVRRHGAGLPVAARPATLGYRFRLFVRRNRVALGATFLIVAALAAGLAATAWQARTARLEARKATQIAEFVVDLFEVSDPVVSQGDAVTARQLLDRGAERVEAELADQPLVQAQMAHLIGTIYSKLSLYEPAEQMHRRALALRTGELGPQSDETAESLTGLGGVAVQQGRYAEADSLLDAALAILRRPTRNREPGLAVALTLRAVSARHQNDLELAEALHREALEMRRAAFGNSDSRTLASLRNLALVLHSMNRLEEAEAAYREALALMDRDGVNQPDAGTILHSLAALVRTRGRSEEAQSLAERALDVQRTVHGPRHRLVGNALTTLAVVVDERGDIPRAVELYAEALALKRELLGDAHPSVATSLNNLALSLRDLGRLDEAETNLAEALAIYRGRFGERHPSVAIALMNLGSVALRRGEWDGAANLYADALEILRESYPGPHLTTAIALVGLGEASLGLADPEGAEVYLREALNIREELLGPPHWRLAEVRTLLSRAVAQQGRYGEAESLAVAAVGSVAETGSRLDAEQLARAREAVQVLDDGSGPVP